MSQSSMFATPAYFYPISAAGTATALGSNQHHQQHAHPLLATSFLTGPTPLQVANASGAPLTQHHMPTMYSNKGIDFSKSSLLGDSCEMSSSAPSPPNGAPVERTSKTNLYIKGLPDDFTDQRLKDLVPDPTLVKSVKAATEDDSKCRGYGFIDFFNEEAAQFALRHIQTNHASYTIKFAKENEKDKTNLYVTNIPKSWTTKDSERLKEIFERFGQIQSAFIMLERSTNKATGVGFVRFASEDDAQRAIESIKSKPIVLSGCNHPVEAKYADKHNPETRRRRNAGNQLNNGLRVALQSGSQIPLIATSPTATSFATPSIYNSIYGTQFYRSNAAAAATMAAALTNPLTSYTPFPLTSPYQSLTAGQSLITPNGTLYQMPSAAVSNNQSTTFLPNAATLQALNSHVNGAAEANFSPHLFLTNPSSLSYTTATGATIDYATLAAAAAAAAGMMQANPTNAYSYLHTAAGAHIAAAEPH